MLLRHLRKSTPRIAFLITHPHATHKKENSSP
jgi:hypothetical protein